MYIIRKILNGSGSKNMINGILKSLDLSLRKTDYFIGNSLIIADIPAGCLFKRCKNFGTDMSAFVRFSIWSKRLYERKIF